MAVVERLVGLVPVTKAVGCLNGRPVQALQVAVMLDEAVEGGEPVVTVDFGLDAGYIILTPEVVPELSRLLLQASLQVKDEKYITGFTRPGSEVSDESA